MIVYVASPYSHDDPFERDKRYIQARNYIAWRTRYTREVAYFSPIVYAHEMANKHQLPKDAEWWKSFNSAFLEECYMMDVLTLDGWEESVGVQWEIMTASKMKAANEFPIPIRYFRPDPEVRWREWSG